MHPTHAPGHVRPTPLASLFNCRAEARLPNDVCATVVRHSIKPGEPSTFSRLPSSTCPALLIRDIDPT